MSSTDPDKLRDEASSLGLSGIDMHANCDG
jgi:hypothetical protein